MPFAALLVMLAEPIAKQVLIALGVGIISYAGCSLAIDSIVSHINTVLGSTSQNVLMVATLFGVPQSLAIILGGAASAASVSAVKRFGIL